MGDLIVRVDDVARRLGLRLPLSEDARWVLETAVGDAQSDVEAYLGRPLYPARYTEERLWPSTGGGWDLQHGPVTEIVSQTPETYPDTGAPTGRWTVVYLAGLDAAADPELAPIRRFVTAHTMNTAQVRALVERIAPDAAGQGRRAVSLSAEGQSVAYDYDLPASATPPGGGAPGSLPTLKSLDRWRLAGRRVVQRPGDPWASQPWPYDRPLPGAWW